MKRTYLHPLPLRVWHWVNALIVALLLATGIRLRLAGIPDLPPHSTALLIHRYAGWAMVASCLVWLIYGLASDHLGRHYTLRRRDIKGIFSQTRFYVWSIFRGEENPFRPSPDEKFNPLQKLAYGAVMCIFTPVLVVTGLLFSDVPARPQIYSALEHREAPRCRPRHRRVSVRPLPRCPCLHGDARQDAVFPHKGNDRRLRGGAGCVRGERRAAECRREKRTMANYGGWAGKVLHVDLSTGRTWTDDTHRAV